MKDRVKHDQEAIKAERARQKVAKARKVITTVNHQL